MIGYQPNDSAGERQVRARDLAADRLRMAAIVVQASGRAIAAVACDDLHEVTLSRPPVGVTP
ncbi:hypothetical protein GC170_14895 [bacterium]|nr:hypothetical protein [bacterium]